MADYGVNIKVKVQGQNAAKQLGEQVREIVDGLDAADRAFTRFSNNLKSFDQRRAQRKINEELDKTAQKYRELDRLQRQLLANDNSAIKAAERRAKLEEHISKNISAGRMRRRAQFLRGDPEQYPSGANQPFAPDPMVAIRKQRDAEAKYAREIFDMEQDFARRHNNTQIELLTQRIKREMDLQEDAFQNALRLDKAFMEDHDRRAKAAFEARAQQTRLTGQASPIGGAVGIPGSPAALAAAARSQQLRSATSSALIGGAFPLLFGQGLGASAGGLAGGFGGGMIGGEFGFGVSLIGTQLGTMFDQLVAKATGLASSLKTTESILSGLEEAGFKVSDSTKRVIASYEEAGLLADAYSLAIDEINRVLGPDGADNLHAYKIETEKLQSEFEKASAALQSELIPALTGFLRVILGVKSAIDGFAGTPFGKALLNPNALKQAAFAIPGVGPAVVGGGAFIGKLQEIGAPTGPAEKSKAQIAAEQKELKGQLITRQALNKAAREQGYLVDAQIEAARLGNNLLDEQVVAAKERVIDEIRNAAVRKEGVTFQEIILAGKQRELALANLHRSVNEARLAQQEKELRNADRLEKKNDRIAKKKQKDAERLAKAADRELERADKAFNSTSNQLDKIIQKHEDKMAFEREYAELIRSGSTPAAAKQAIQLQQELLDLDRRHTQLEDELKVRIKIAEAAVLTAEADPNADSTRIDALKKKLEELEGALAGLPGKKEDAEGAIAAALAPKSDRQRLLDYMTELQGQINDMMDPVRRLTALADTLGSAFGESFKGLVSGSMTAREALANLFQRTADHFLDMAAQMIAAKLKMQLLNIGLSFLGGGFGGGASSVPSSAYGDFSVAGPGFFSGGMIPGFANGGRPSVGRPSIVGERGPELFVPDRAGTIVPNHALGGSNIVVNVDASGSSVEGDAQQSKALGQALGAAVKAELIKQKMPGGLLA